MSFKGKKLNNSRGNSSHQGYLWQTVRLTLQKSKQLTWLLLLCIYNSPLFQSSKQSCWKRHFLTNLIFTDASVCKWYTREKLRIEVNRSQTRMRICIIRKKLPKIVWITVFLQEIWELILSGGIHEVNLMRIISIFFFNYNNVKFKREKFQAKLVCSEFTCIE